MIVNDLCVLICERFAAARELIASCRLAMAILTSPPVIHQNYLRDKRKCPEETFPIDFALRSKSVSYISVSACRRLLEDYLTFTHIFLRACLRESESEQPPCRHRCTPLPVLRTTDFFHPSCKSSFVRVTCIYVQTEADICRLLKIHPKHSVCP